MHTKVSQIEDNIFIEKKQIFHCPAIKKCSITKTKSGRCSGGLIYLVDEDLRCECGWLNSRIGYLIINKLIIMNVYLPYHDNDTSVNAHNFEADVKMIEEFYNTKMSQRKYEFIILGDFNVDIIKMPTRAHHLIKTLCITNSLLPIDILSETNVMYTFKRTIEYTTQYSWLDHVFVESSSIEKVKYINIENQFNNRSDHLPIIMKYDFIADRNFASEKREIPSNELMFDWEDENFTESSREQHRKPHQTIRRRSNGI